MTRKIATIKEGSYVHCEVTDELHIDEVIAGLKEMSELSERVECDCFVIDLTQAMIRFNFTEVDYIIDEFRKQGFKKAKRIAFVRSKDKKIGRFAENAFYNNGWGNVKNFDTRSEAVDWVNQVIRVGHRKHVYRNIP